MEKIAKAPTWTIFRLDQMAVVDPAGFIGTIEDDEEVDNDDIDSGEDDVRR